MLRYDEDRQTLEAVDDPSALSLRIFDECRVAIYVQRIGTRGRQELQYRIVDPPFMPLAQAMREVDVTGAPGGVVKVDDRTQGKPLARNTRALAPSTGKALAALEDGPVGVSSTGTGNSGSAGAASSVASGAASATTGAAAGGRKRKRAEGEASGSVGKEDGAAGDEEDAEGEGAASATVTPTSAAASGAGKGKATPSGKKEKGPKGSATPAAAAASASKPPAGKRPRV